MTDQEKFSSWSEVPDWLKKDIMRSINSEAIDGSFIMRKRWQYIRYGGFLLVALVTLMMWGCPQYAVYVKLS